MCESVCVIISLILAVLLTCIKNKHKYHPYIYKAMVLVKVSNPTKSQIQRYYKWKESMSSEYKFEILSDKNFTLPNITVNVVKPEELFRKWPNMLKIGGQCYNKGVSYTMWICIVEHYALFVKKSNIKFKYLWMVEQDLGYSGNLYEFMKQYDNDNVDVILKEWWKQNTGWWSECYTPEYYIWRVKYHYGYKYQSYNWISRLSYNAINLLYKEFELGRHVFNEEALPERIGPLNMTYKFFSSSSYGYKLDWNARVNEKEWKSILKNPKHQNKLFHALKF